MCLRTTTIVAALEALLHCASALALSLQIIPPSPRYQEHVVARMIRPPLNFGVIYGATVSMQSNTIRVVYYEYPELSTSSHDVSLGQLPAGTYDVELRRHGSDAIEATARFTVAESPVPSPLYTGRAQLPSVNFSGQWWNPDESGWGLAITQGPTNVLFAEWFVYGPDGKPVWYTLFPGSWTSGETFMTFEGPVFQAAGSYWAHPYSPTTLIRVGDGSLSFGSAFKGKLNFVIGGVRTVKDIERLPIE